MFQKGSQLLSGSPRRPPLPSPSPWAPPGPGAAPALAAVPPGLRPRRRRGEGLSAPGWGWTRSPRTRVCPWVLSGGAGREPDLRQPFQRGWRRRAGRGRVAHCPPALVSKPPPVAPGAAPSRALAELLAPRPPAPSGLRGRRTAAAGPGDPAELAAGPGGAPPRPPGVRALAGRRPFPLDLSLGVTKAPFYFQCHFGVCLLFPATSRFQGYGRLPAGSGRGERLQR